MSSLLEDPGRPLIGPSQKRLPPAYESTPLPAPLTRQSSQEGSIRRRSLTSQASCCSSTGDGGPTRDGSVRRSVTMGIRLAQRKDLFVQRRRLCDISVALAVTGILIMMLETELAAHQIIDRSQVRGDRTCCNQNLLYNKKRNCLAKPNQGA